MTKKHEFIWRYGGKQVILTGNWDNWAASGQPMRYHADSGVFKCVLDLDPTVAWQFKFVVDGIWRCSLDFPTCCDAQGNANNVLYPETDQE